MGFEEFERFLPFADNFAAITFFVQQLWQQNF